MTKQELIAKLKDLQGPGDTENQHVQADELLIEYIADADIEAAYEEVDKWYA